MYGGGGKDYMKLFIYTLIIGIFGYGLQMNAFESVGITFFVVMEIAGIIVHIMRKPNPQIMKSETNNIGTQEIDNTDMDAGNKPYVGEVVECRWIKQLTKGLGCMIFAVFLFLNSAMIAESFIGMGISWIIMLFGIVTVLFSGDENRNTKKVGEYEKWQ